MLIFRSVCLLGVLTFSQPGQAEITPQRQQAITYTVQQDCGSCHGLTLKGGLGPNLLAKRLRKLPDDYLSQVIRNGVPNTPMPPWQPFFNDEEIQWIVTQLKQGNF